MQIHSTQKRAERTARAMASYTRTPQAVVHNGRRSYAVCDFDMIKPFAEKGVVNVPAVFCA